MSSQDGWTNSQLRKPVLDVDLNVLPPSENQGREGTSTHTRSLYRQEGIIMLDVPIDLEADDDDDDDDVIISSRRAFAEAKNNSRKKRWLSVVDVDSEEGYTNSGIYINLEDNNNFKPQRGQSGTVSPPPPPLPKEISFNCPICMGLLVEEMSTKCGHIFCKVCIRKAIAAQNKCPTCRKKITLKNIFKIYLPATNSS